MCGKAVELDAWVQKRFDPVAHSVMRGLGVTRGFLYYACAVGSNVLLLAADSIGPHGITASAIALTVIAIFFAHLCFRRDELAEGDPWRHMDPAIFWFFLALKYLIALLLLVRLIEGVMGPRAVGPHAISMSRFIGASILNVVAHAGVLCTLYVMSTPKQPPPRKEKEAKKSVQALQSSAA